MIVEVLDHAPDTLTWRERWALIVLAENANDDSRECWPGIEDDPGIAHRMRLSGRSSRYEVLKALREKKALESVSAGHRGRRAVYRIPSLGPAKGPGSTDPIDSEGSGNPGQSVQDPRTQSTGKGPGNPDPMKGKGSGNDSEWVREPHGKGPGNPDPYSSDPSTPHEEEASTEREGAAAAAPGADREITAAEKREFGNFWALHPKSRNLDKTREVWVAAVLSGVDPKKITAAAQAYAREVAGQEFRFIKQSDNWIRERRYEDKFAPEPTRGPRGQLPPWCTECADGNRAAEREGHLRLIYDDAGNSRPCPKCHPTQTAHAA